MTTATIYSLTDRQEVLWVDDEMHPEFPINNVLIRLTIEGFIDTDAFIRAFNHLCTEYSIFSSAIKLDSTSGHRVFKLLEKSQVLELIKSDESSILAYEKTSSFQEWCNYKFTYGEHLYKARIVKFSNNLFIFYLNQHHSITDGFSCNKLPQLLSDYYQIETGIKDVQESQPQIKDNFFDFLTKKQEQKQSKLFESKNNFWLSRYSQAVEPVQFYNQPSYNKTAQTRRVTCQVENDIVLLLNKVSLSISTSVIFISILLAFLNRISLNKDLSIGVQSSRTGKYLNALGLLMEVCPYRVNVKEGDTFDDLIKKVKAEIEAVNEYQDHFVSSRKAGYEVTLNFQSAIAHSFAGITADYEQTTPLNILDDLDLAISGTEEWAGRESLAVQVHESSDKLCYKLTFDFNLGVWQSSTLRERAVKHFSILLKQFLIDSTQKIAEVDLLTPDEKLLLFPKEDSAYVRADMVPLVIDLFRQQVNANPNKVAIQFNEQDISYVSLATQVDSLAQQLYQLGVKPGVLVGVCIDRSPKMVVCLLAIMRSGGAYVPIDPKQPSDRIFIILEDANPLVLITETNLRHKVAGDSSKPVICLDDNPEKIVEKTFKYPVVKGDDLAYVIFTSGSTGRPKGVEVCHHGLTTFLQAMSEQPGMNAQDIILSVTTISFDIAALELFLPLILGATVRIAPYEATINGEALISLLQKNISVLQATPATYRLLISSGWKGESNLKVLCGGEALPYELAQQLIPKCSSLWNMYGPTETTIWSSIHQVTKEENFISIGKPIIGTQMFVLNEYLKPVPIGVPGELYIAGDGIAKGYYKNIELTSLQFQPNLFSDLDNTKMYKTGDLVRYSLDLNLQYIGRIDFQVKVRGFRIETGEVETVLGNHNSVGQCVVTTWPDEFGEQTLIAYLLASNEFDIDGGKLREYLKIKLPNYMIPSRLILLEALPLTPNGKVDRKALPDPKLSIVLSTGTEYVKPRNDFERSLVSVWKEILKAKQIGIADDFFDLGGDSLMTVELVHQMESATGIKFDIGDVFNFPTIKQLVEAQGEGIEKRASSIVPLQSKGSGIPLFFLCGINIYQELANSLGDGQPIYSIYVAEEQAFLESVIAGQRHELSIEQLALSYYEAICRQQPEGPYQLAGISFGGLLAVETARLLKKNNKDVLSVILLDTILPAGIQRGILNKCKKTIKDGLNMVYTYFSRRYIFLNHLNTLNASNIREQAFIKCMEKYKSSEELYDGHVVLMKAKDRSSWGKGVSFLPDYGWGKFIKGNIDSHDIPGDHLGIIKQPNVVQLARYMLPYLKTKV